MKRTDKQTLQAKSSVELQKLIEEAYNTLGQLKLDNVQNKLKNTRTIFHTRKEIAIMRTLLQMKETAVPVEEASTSAEKAKGGKK